MGMDPMAAQGMFGGYGMNMNGMNNGMNMGMNYDQGMYGGWDGSQNNMWNGGQDKFNPNAFPNGMGPEFGGPSGFGGYNMSQPHGNYMQQQQQFPNQDFQNGFYGPGYGRGAARGRGRGYFPGGRDRGGFMGHMQANHPATTNHHPGFQNQPPPNMPQPNGTPAKPDDGPGAPESAAPTAEDIKKFNDELAPGGEDELTEEQPRPTTTDSIENKDVPKDAASDPKAADAPSTEPPPAAEESQLRGIPTIESIDQAANVPNHIPTGPAGYQPQPGFGFGRGGLPMRGGFHHGGRGGGFANGPFGPSPHQPVPPTEPRGQGVAGAPAAPRAMREGLPNTGMRNRVFPGRAPMPPPPAPAPKPADDAKRYVCLSVRFILTERSDSLQKCDPGKPPGGAPSTIGLQVRVTTGEVQVEIEAQVPVQIQVARSTPLPESPTPPAPVPERRGQRARARAPAGPPQEEIPQGGRGRGRPQGRQGTPPSFPFRVCRVLTEIFSPQGQGPRTRPQGQPSAPVASSPQPYPQSEPESQSQRRIVPVPRPRVCSARGERGRGEGQSFGVW